MIAPRPWFCCVRLNDHDKAYFDRQLAGFTRTDPLPVTWEDTRAAPARPSVQPGTPWERLLPIPGARRLQAAGLRLRVLATENPFAAPARERAWFRRLAETDPPSVIYAHTAFVALRLLPLKATLGVALVAHFHGLDVTRRDPVWRNALRAALPKIDRLIVVGDWMHARLTELGADPGVIQTIPMGAPIDAAARNTPAPRTGERFRFVTVGRLVPCKGSTGRSVRWPRSARPNW